ncbi:ATP-dependent bile acid permease [Colletotrichum higginsianum IMI 349063]|uniref:ATP-dependent bile acid permease n=2 Tax=Colletotrichum higginsianum (strain IMI 349063) TaxID=759273 RepID=A0A1B7Y8F6_COLHI|nr:ATP-dependent bile acid permease [Colletotrichum higginsianum IMI 349063]OBR08341.1 ATP-dependent bile acid permease [Colletotrichum higginsianum IMI 349063]
MSLPLSGAALAVAALSSSVAAYNVFRQLRIGKPKGWFYEDVDGYATPKALAEFSSRGIKVAVLLFSAIGTGTSIAGLVLSTVYKFRHGFLLENSLNAAAWGLVLLQAICIAVLHSPVESHNLGIWLTVSSCFLAVSSAQPLSYYFTAQFTGQRAVMGLVWLISALDATMLAAVSGMLPRRPEIVYDGAKVDRQWTVSLLNRLTWSWIQPLLRHASLHDGLEGDDVPHADFNLRSKQLAKEWNKFEHKPTLFLSLAATYKGRLAVLWAATLVRCAVSILPFWFMLRILKILETEVTRSNPVQLFIFVLGMAVSNLADSWMEGWAYWYSLADLALPIRTQISGLIFDKALRRKNVRAAGPDDSAGESEQADAASAEDSFVPKSRQVIVNLVGVDTERLSYFFQFQFLILNGVVKLVIFSFFLLQLLGWIPFCAGIAAWAVTLPPNAWFSRKVLAESQSLMRHRDAKLSKMNEVLLGLRQIKFSGLESRWERRILALRETELKTLWKFFLADSGLFACWVISPIFLAVASLVTHVFIEGSLLPSVAFVSIGILNSLETTLGSLPELLTLALDSLVSLRRIDAYLKESEREALVADGSCIVFERASISWHADEDTPQKDRFTMDEISLSFPKGALSVISGKVGTGKTLLLSAILGEADLLSGSIRVPKKQTSKQDVPNTDKWVIPGSIAYISQTPWLENASLRNNVLFGLPFNKERYDDVLDACALREDLAALPDGDGTELGANGVNLSGGQKWRVTLARAVYSRAEILLMEDIFSAVDSHVGAWIFEKCLTGDLCRGRTRVLVTHHLGLVLPEAEFLVELGDGGVVYSGSAGTRAPSGSRDQGPSDVVIAGSVDSDPGAKSTADVVNPERSQLPEPLTSPPRKFMQEESRQKGTVKASVYLTYVRCSGGLYLWAACLGVYLTYQVGIIGRAWWLRIWTGEANVNAASGSFLVHPAYNSPFATQQLFAQTADQSPTKTDVLFYVQVYVAISLGTALIGVLRNISSYFLAVRASRALFEKMLFAVMRVTLRWLDTVPTGRILNRFTADFSVIDERIAMTWSLFLSNLLRLVGICVASCFASPYLIIPAVVLLGFGVVAGSKYLVVSRPLKRLESNAKSPVFELFNTTLAGLSTIRAFRKTQTYLEQMHRSLDTWAMTTFYIALANRWMSFRMALIAALFSVAVGVVITVKPIDAALTGLALTFILDFSESLRWMVRCYGDMELEMNSMERVVEYMALETEPLAGENPAAVWPTSGSIEFEKLEVGYAPDLPPVLTDLSLRIRHGERIGVVGRTGAGKSSLTLALFRFLEARSGSITIDGLDISKLNLTDLRSRISIVPQHPVLFSGTLRSNLDPFGEYANVELHEALARFHLTGSSSSHESDESGRDTNLFRDLSSPVSESGGNLSQGQQQLVCIARALLADSKIVVLDEATSSIDAATDDLIQQSIRSCFVDRTLIVVAHRLRTVSDFDRILVLDGGRMVEFGTPRELWDNEGVFRGMCDSTGEKEELRQSIVG